jgi:uncharacterized protein (DUF952 family)
MYYIPLLINNRRWFVAPFTNAHEDIHNTHFVIPLDDSGKAHLISLDKSLGEVFSDHSDNIPFDNLSFGTGGNSEKKLTIELGEINYFFKLINEEEDGNCFGLDYNVDNPKDGKYKVTLQLKVDGESFRSEITFHVAKSENSFEAVMDFGSESSQISYKGYKDTEPKQVDILQELVSFNSSWQSQAKNISEGRKEFVQKDNDSRFFYKSKFRFANTSIGEKSGYVEHRLSTNSDSEDYVNAPFSKKEEAVLITERINDYDNVKDGFRIPNLKILELYPDVFQNIMVNTVSKSSEYNDDWDDDLEQESFKDVRHLVLREIKNNFAYVAIQALCKEIRKRNLKSAEHRVIHFKLLVPNIYSYEDSLSLLKEFKNDLAEIISKGKLGKNGTIDINNYIDAFEVSILSESDASFLGAHSANDDLKVKVSEFNNSKNKIALIDCGKGTTDISIVSIEDECPISHFRGGFAGAGNYLTYGFVESILKSSSAKSNEEYVSILKKIVADKDTATLDNFMDSAEKLKRAFDSSNSELVLDDIDINDVALKEWLVPNELTLRELYGALDKIKNKKIQDDGGILQHHIEELSQKIVDELGNSNISLGEIKLFVLTGRGFMLDNFRQSVIHKICEARDRINRNNPLKKKSDPEKLFPNLQSGIANLKEICLYGAFTKVNMLQTDNPTFDINIFKSGLSVLGRTIIKGKSERVRNMEFVLQNGLDIKITNKTTGRIEISNMNYTFDMNEVDGDLTLYFIGNLYNSEMPYILKSGEKIIALKKEVDPILSVPNEFVIKSLFPYVEEKYLEERYLQPIKMTNNPPFTL